MTDILLKQPLTLKTTIQTLIGAWGEFTTSPLNLIESLQETDNTIDIFIDGPWSLPRPVEGSHGLHLKLFNPQSYFLHPRAVAWLTGRRLGQSTSNARQC